MNLQTAEEMERARPLRSDLGRRETAADSRYNGRLPGKTQSQIWQGRGELKVEIPDSRKLVFAAGLAYENVNWKAKGVDVRSKSG